MAHTPEEKAKELVAKFTEHFYGFGIDQDIRHKEGKECAIIAVDEIIKEYESLNNNTGWDWDAYLSEWDKVKEAILKL